MSTTLRVRPRVETIAWSLYWKEPLYIKTKCLDDIEVAVPAGATGSDLLRIVAKQLGWRAVDTLQRIQGFSQPWERLILLGRELSHDAPVDTSKVEDAVVVVRRELKADGWRIAQDNDFLTSDEDEDSEEGEAFDTSSRLM